MLNHILFAANKTLPTRLTPGFMMITHPDPAAIMILFTDSAPSALRISLPMTSSLFIPFVISLITPAPSVSILLSRGFTKCTVCNQPHLYFRVDASLISPTTVVLVPTTSQPTQQRSSPRRTSRQLPTEE